MENIVFETRYARLVIGSSGKGVRFIDRVSGIPERDYARHDEEIAFAKARVLVAGQRQEYDATSAFSHESQVVFTFGKSGATATIDISSSASSTYFHLRVVSASPEIEELTFCDIPLTLKGSPDEPFAACTLALNLKANVVLDEGGKEQSITPGPCSRLRARCYHQKLLGIKEGAKYDPTLFGIEGAEIALIGCPPHEMRDVMKDALSAAVDIPHSSVGGPWALDGSLKRCSHLLYWIGDWQTEKHMADLVKTVRSLGFTQIQIHGSGKHNPPYGDYFGLDPAIVPKDRLSIREVVDRLHLEGISVFIQPFAFLIDETCEWITPKAHEGLRKYTIPFRLKVALPGANSTNDDVTIEVVIRKEDLIEQNISEAGLSSILAQLPASGGTLQIDQELIRYGSIEKKEPYEFTGCKRGAYGTEISGHMVNTPVKPVIRWEGVKMFVPDPNSDLFEMVAAKTAALCNEAGFDGIYFDALDGEGWLGNPWHPGSRYVFEVWKRLQRPTLMDYSTFRHHLWHLCSRIGSWDAPHRGYIAFIKEHMKRKQEHDRMLLPSYIGWWPFVTWDWNTLSDDWLTHMTTQTVQHEVTHCEDIEYLCVKALATDRALAINLYHPHLPAHQRLADIVKKYEEVREGGQLAETVKAELRKPEREFSLVRPTDGETRFQEICLDRHCVESARTSTWPLANRFAAQPLVVRIEAIAGCSRYDDPSAIEVWDLSCPTQFASNSGVELEIQQSTEQVKVGKSSAKLTAYNSLQTRSSSWAWFGFGFTAPKLDMSRHGALGVWVHGDRNNEVLNFQIASPQSKPHAIGDRYVIVDFAGWQYFELVELEGARWFDFIWPYNNVCQYDLELSQIEVCRIWVNNLLPKQRVTCYLSPIRALPVQSVSLKRPSISIGGKRIEFGCDIGTGQYLEFVSTSDCKLFDKDGKVIIEKVECTGDVPVLNPGRNDVIFTCEGIEPEDINPRARVTTSIKGELI